MLWRNQRPEVSFCHSRFIRSIDDHPQPQSARLQGLVGLGAAIDWFTRNGFFVAIPLNDSQPWDLIVEDTEGVVSRVQVKTTTFRHRYGRFVVHLQTAGGNRSFHTRKPFDPMTCELLFVLTDEGDVYVIPTSAIKVRTSLNLCAKYERYRREPWRQLVVGEGFEPSKAEPRRLQRRSFGHSDIPPEDGNGRGDA